MKLRSLCIVVFVAAAWIPSPGVFAADSKILFIAGRISHGPLSHEHRAGCLLLAKSLAGIKGITTEVHTDGWVSDEKVFENAAAIIVYSDGGGGHPLLQGDRLAKVGALMKKGVGLGTIHYAVEPTTEKGNKEFRDWIGGCFETHWSVNPHWTAEFTQFPKHPVTQGVKPFKTNDEWYYHMRFREGMQGVTPILTAMPAANTTGWNKDKPADAKTSSHGGNPHVFKSVVERKEAQHLMWVAERDGGGRGFGFTGGHNHLGWGNDEQRKLIGNAILWVANVAVPAAGVESKITQEELMANLDPKGGAKPKPTSTTLAPVPAPKAAPVPAPKLAVPTPKPGGKEPGAAVANLDVHPELQATLFAAEPMLMSPSNTDVDHRGRVWVCEVINYRGHKGKRPEGDRILILEDTNGDGVAEKAKVFYQGKDIDSPHGVCVLGTPDGRGTRVIVSAGDKVQVFTDVDGDDKPDKQEVLFSGISGTQHDHGIHAFVFGPDGRLYFNFGNSGNQIKDKDGKPIIDMAGNEVKAGRKPYQEGMVFRCNLDGSGFETLAWNFRNNWMVTVDSFGTLWQSDNDDDGNKGVRINFVMEFGNYGYRQEITGAGWGDDWKKAQAAGAKEDLKGPYQWHQFDPGVVPNLIYTGQGSPTGITVYEGDLLPKAFHGQMIHCDAGPSVVRAYPVTRDGAGYKGETLNILEGTRDRWFRPADVKVAPDGSLIVADWYDPGVGGHAMGDLERGRLFRVTPKGHTGYKMPKFDFATAEGCAEAMKNPNFAVRQVAWTALNKMQAKAQPALEKLAKDADPRLRARALWLLAAIKGNTASAVETALTDSSDDLRGMALRIARLHKLDVLPLVKKLSADRSPLVRRECLIALRHHTAADMPALWAELAKQHDGKDRWYLEALGIGADRRENECLDAWLKSVGGQWNTPAGRDVLWRSRGTHSAKYLADLVTDKTASATDKTRCLRALDFIAKSKEKDDALARIALGGL
ncbi:MAG: hypothetical protein EXS22_07895 [Pedosphaera sp.]|nr:hypothetical protein [Pedosphaera sp.]MSU43944.1 hypothetical protein [Pedosphaera sp.]